MSLYAGLRPRDSAQRPIGIQCNGQLALNPQTPYGPSRSTTHSSPARRYLNRS
jgi:hypothetical protein